MASHQGPRPREAYQGPQPPTDPRLHRTALWLDESAKIDAELLENYYALLQTCKHNGSRLASHKDHECEPLANSSVRAIHFILRAALDRAVKWGYLGKNAATLAEPPSFGTPEPDPPTPEELAPVINEAWRSGMGPVPVADDDHGQPARGNLRAPMDRC